MWDSWLCDTRLHDHKQILFLGRNLCKKKVQRGEGGVPLVEIICKKFSGNKISRFARWCT